MANITGTANNDTLSGTSADDQYTGLAGNDVFAFTSRGFDNDVIVDFVRGQDRIDLSAFGIADLATLSPFISDSLGNAVIRFFYGGQLETITINGVSSSQLAASDFIFNTSTTALAPSATSSNDLLFGGNGNDTLNGSQGNDTLTGGAGADTLQGEVGNDTYYVDNRDDVVNEFGGQGTDTVLVVASADLTEYALAPNAEIEVLRALDRASTLALALVGNETAQRIDGNNGSNNLRGGSGADTLYGYDGDDYLIGGQLGGIGADVMVGGRGSDNYQVNNAADVVTELAGEGTDKVFAYVTEYTLPDNVENLGFGIFGSLAVGNALDNVITNAAGVIRGLDGNDTLSTWDSFAGYGVTNNDTLEGGNGNDILTGGAGQDRLSGGAGNDLFMDNAAGLNGDTITDFALGDKIVITDANIGAFSFALSGTALTYSGGALNLQTAPGQMRLAATGNPGGGVALTLQLTSVRNDFNGDGRSDLLWRNVNGQLSSWLGTANGGLQDNGAIVNQSVPTAWRIQGTADFNGDGRSDVLWRNVNGQLSSWLGSANGGLIDNGSVVNQFVSLDWKIAGTGDFNGDGRSDVLWRNDNGRLSQWLGTSNGGLSDNFGNVNSFVPTSWKVAEIADFNGDGRADVLWRNDSGQLSQWLGTASGALTDNGALVNQFVPNAWKIQDAADFNGDGFADVLWRNDNGQLSQWLGSASGRLIDNGTVVNQFVPNAWQIAGTGDFNGDGRADVMWRNVSGQLSEWLGTANGGFIDNGAVVNQLVPTAWQIHIEDYQAL